MDELQKIGMNIVRLCKQKGWSRAKLSEETGICPDNLRRIETGTGNPRAKTMLKIADALGVTLLELIE
jgi:transcriptional regulator